ncbi:glycosyltransferase [Natronospora cellulosivora (SeqCode)]
MAKTLSLCMIAKNEANNISRCINSALKFVDEIIVIDTGSCDNTGEIALSLGAKVFWEEWENDFSKARNSSLEKASSDWILFMDCDEELNEETAISLHDYLEDDLYEAYFLKVKNIMGNNEDMTFPAVRLFKNREDYRFTGKIHEQIVNPIISKYGQNKIGYANIEIKHYGYDSSLVNIERKINRNLEILKDYPEENKDGFYFFNLATEFLRLNKNEKALENFLIALDKTSPERYYGPVLVKKAMTTLINMKKYQDAVLRLQYYQSIYKDFADLYFLESFAHKNCGRYTEGLKCMEKYNQVNNKSFLYPAQESYNGITAEAMITYLGKHCINKKPSLSVCIIAKDEGKNLIRSIFSVNEIADEIIYIDTGSTDNSIEVAYQMGAKVYKKEWRNSYSEIKNYAITHAKGDWIFSLNGDEFLGENQGMKISKEILNREAEGFILKIVSFRDMACSLSKASVKGKCILFKNKGHFFKGDCDEDITSSIITMGGNVEKADIQVNHLDINDEENKNNKDIIKKNIILNLKNKEMKNYLLAKYYFEKNNYLESQQFFQKYLQEKKEEHSLSSDFIYFYTLTFLNLKKYKEVIKILQDIENVFPDYPDLIYIRGTAYYMLGDLNKAEQSFKYCLEIGEAAWDKYIINPGTGSFKVFVSLAVLYSKKGDLSNSLDSLIKACNISGGLELAISTLVELFQNFNFEFSLEDFLINNNLNSFRVYLIIAATYRKYADYEKSYIFMDKAAGLYSSDNNIDYKYLLQESESLYNDYLSNIGIDIGNK